MVKDYKDYIEALADVYPGIGEDVIEKTIKKGLSELQGLINRDHDIRLENLHCNFDQYRLIMYRSQLDEKMKQKRYFRNLIRIEKLREDKKERYAKKLQSK